MKSLLNLKTFLITTLIFIIVGSIVLASWEKVAIHLEINGAHNEFFDFFFKYWTHAGDGLVALLVLPIGLLLFKKYRYSTFILGWSSLIFAGVLSQFMKRVIFPNAHRPVQFIQDHTLYLVPDVDIHLNNSFPSGHTTAAFAFWAFVAFMFFQQNKLMQFLMVICAVLVGYSRMYLSQHFLEDVVTGASLGIISFTLGLLVTQRISPKIKS